MGSAGFTKADFVVGALGAATRLLLPKSFSEMHLRCCSGDNILPKGLRHWNEQKFFLSAPKFQQLDNETLFLLSGAELYHIYSDMVTLSFGDRRSRRTAQQAGEALLAQIPDVADLIRDFPSRQVR